MKICTACREAKSPEEFNKNKRTKDGLRFQCRKCQSAEYRNNRAAVIERVAKWQDENREAVAQYKRAWWSENAGYSKQHYANNRERYSEQARKWQKENAALVAVRNRKWKEANPEKVSASRQNRRARCRQAEGFHTAEDISRIYIAQGGKCVYCGSALVRRRKGKMHIDHVIPLAKGGTNWPSNLQLLCPACNLSKGAKDPFEFAQNLGMLL